MSNQQTHSVTTWDSQRPAADSTPLKMSCHCGRVNVTVPAAPARLNECQCSVCYSYGSLWAYYRRADVTIEGETKGYVRENDEAGKDLGFFHCPTCGMVTHWAGTADTPKRKGPEAKMGVNCRMLPPDAIKGVERHLT
jgi:hypothetical protein